MALRERKRSLKARQAVAQWHGVKPSAPSGLRGWETLPLAPRDARPYPSKASFVSFGRSEAVLRNAPVVAVAAAASVQAKIGLPSAGVALPLVVLSTCDAGLLVPLAALQAFQRRAGPSPARHCGVCRTCDGR